MTRAKKPSVVTQVAGTNGWTRTEGAPAGRARWATCTVAAP